jgi:hypothetical protein
MSDELQVPRLRKMAQTGGMKSRESGAHFP